MSAERLCEILERRAPGQWELYRKIAESRETTAFSPVSDAACWRWEEGWAARWWEGGSPRFASGSTAELLEKALADARRAAVAVSAPPRWPAARTAPAQGFAEVASPPELFESLARLLSVESHGEAFLSELTVRRGSSAERIRNAAGLDVSLARWRLDGHAVAIGRKGARACEARVLFRWDEEPELTALARRLADRATLPLSDRATPVARGEWLLDPSVAAALLASLAPLFCGEPLPRGINRARFFSSLISVVDDAAADAPFDGEGTATRRVVLVDAGGLQAFLRDLCAARESGAEPTGHGVRPSYRRPPRTGIRRLFFESSDATAPRELLSRVRRGLFASALTAPARIDLEHDRFELEFTGVALLAGRALGPVAGARASGRLSEVLRRIVAIGTDRQFFALPDPVGAPTLLIERASFD